MSMSIKGFFKSNKALYSLWLWYYIYFGKTRFSKSMREFIILNKKIWSNRGNAPKSNDNVLITFTTDAPDSFWYVMKRVEAYREVHGGKIFAVLDGHFKDNNNIQSILESYAIDQFIYYEGYNRKSSIKKEYKKAIEISDEFFMRARTIDDFLEWSIDEVKIGDLLYDKIIRNHDIYTIKTIDEIREKYRADIIECVRKYVFFKDVLLKNDIKLFMTNEYAYFSGIPIRISVKNGIKTVCESGLGITEYNDSNIYTSIYTLSNRISRNQLLLLIQDEQFKKGCREYFDNRFYGKINVFDGKNAYGSKQLISAEALTELLQIDLSKKIVLLAPHVFSDACHIHEQWIFKDYYEWLDYTLKVIGDKEDINLIFKPHPSAMAYGNSESEAIREFIDRYKHLIIVPSNVSTASVLSISDVVLTASGTIGLEACCLGLDAVNVCRSYYSGYGLTREIKSREEYNLFLNSISCSTRKLSDLEKDMAKAVLFMVMNYGRDRDVMLNSLPITPEDDFGEMVERQYEYLNSKLQDEKLIIDKEYIEWLKVF